MTPASSTVSGTRKAAMFIMGVGGALGAELLRQLEPDEILRISAEISNLHAVAPESMLSVFREFETLSGSSKFFAKGEEVRGKHRFKDGELLDQHAHDFRAATQQAGGFVHPVARGGIFAGGTQVRDDGIEVVE